jgi:hypothetical protein
LRELVDPLGARDGDVFSSHAHAHSKLEDTCCLGANEVEERHALSYPSLRLESTEGEVGFFAALDKDNRVGTHMAVTT